MTMSLNIPMVAFEGMPRSGKSTILSIIVENSESKVVLLKELYFTAQQLEMLADKRGTIKESKWFIDQEIRRKKIIDRLAVSSQMVLVDRMHLSTLAYCYARSMVTNNRQEFDDLVEYVVRNHDNFIKYNLIIVFDNSIEVSLSDRRIDKTSGDAEFWVNREFMEYYRKFYITEVGKYTDTKIITINTEGRTLEEVYGNVTNCLMDTFVKNLIK